MLSQALQDAINEQIGKEFYSSYLYLGMAAHFEAANLPGFAGWMKKQADEERAHGMRLWEHLTDRGGRVMLRGIEPPPVTYGKPREVLEQVLEHEQKITASIHALYALAAREGDIATQICLQWFVNEQVEEEKQATELVERLKMAGEQPFGILFMDQHVMGHRK